MDALFPELEARLAAVDAGADPIARIDARTALAWELRFRERDRAHALATEARLLAQEHGYALGRARAARVLAMTVREATELSTVVALAEEAKQYFDEAEDLAGRAGSRDFLASIHEHLGDFARGLELALEALGLARELGDPVRQGYALSSVGGILAASGEVDSAVERLMEALKLFEGVQNLDGVGVILSRLSKVFISAGRHDEALKYAARCLELSEQGERPDVLLQASALTVMAEIAEKRDEPAEAERLYRASIDVMQEPMRNLVGVEAQVSLGRLLMRQSSVKQGALAEAEFELRDVLARVEGKAVSIVAEASAHEALAELLESQGRVAEAISHLRRGVALREQIAGRETRTKLAQLEARAALETARKDAEIHKLRFVELHGLQSKLLEAEKLALLGRLAAGTAHELNTPLGVLRSNAQLSETITQRLTALIHELLELVKDGEARSASVAKLVAGLEASRATTNQAMERIFSIVQNFRRFAQLDEAARRSFDVREGLESALALLGPAVPERVRIERHFAEVTQIECWPRELNQAFLTILQNAVQAIAGPGTVRVEVEQEGAQGRAQVLVRISDTGRGMSEEDALHLFDVTWSNEGPRAKMRFGLAAASATVRHHGGTIDVMSALGRGTSVTIRLPRG